MTSLTPPLTTDGQQPPDHDQRADAAHCVHDTRAGLHVRRPRTHVRARAGQDAAR